MRVLVTGHRGYVGSIAAPHLVSRGHVVRGLDSMLYHACSIGALAAVPETVKDIRDVEPADLTDLDAVVHLAALSNDPLGALDPEVTMAINHGGTIRLAELACAAGVRRFVFASSCSVYGGVGEAMTDESSPTAPMTPYAMSKAQAETDLAALESPDFAITILRPGTAYGVSPMIRFDLVLNNLVAWASATGRVALKSDGSAWRPVVHVEDLAAAIAAVLESPAEAVGGEIFNVGRPDHNYRVLQLAEVVAAAIPGAEIEFTDGASPDLRCYRVDFGKLARLPGFEPRWTIEEGARELHETIRELHLTSLDFEGSRYSRVRHLRRMLHEGRVDPSFRWRGAAPS